MEFPSARRIPRKTYFSGLRIVLKIYSSRDFRSHLEEEGLADERAGAGLLVGDVEAEAGFGLAEVVRADFVVIAVYLLA
jgi:hypothetical protein